MKKIFKLATSITLLFLAFALGSSAGNAFGIDGTLTGSLFTAGALIANNPVGSLANGISVSGVNPVDIVSDLSKYMAIESNQMNFFRQLRNGLELAPYVKSIGNQRGNYVGVSSSTSELLQAFQQGWTPKGTTSFVGYNNPIFKLKMDFILDNIDAITDSWLFYLSQENVERKDWPLVKYIMEMELLPKVTEELNTAMCRGNYVAPTTGTAGNSIDSMNGVLTIIADEIADSAITPIVTGSISASNAIARVNTFMDGIDPLVSDKGGIILCSQTVARFYKQNYLATYGLTNDKDAKNNLNLDLYNAKLVPINGFGTSQRLVFATPGNLIHLYDKLVSPSGFTVQQDKRNVAIFSDWHCAIGFQSLQGIFVNDQA
jgi:hypothetical protein